MPRRKVKQEKETKAGKRRGLLWAVGLFPQTGDRGGGLMSGVFEEQRDRQSEEEREVDREWGQLSPSHTFWMLSGEDGGDGGGRGAANPVFERRWHTVAAV